MHFLRRGDVPIDDAPGFGVVGDEAVVVGDGEGVQRIVVDPELQRFSLALQVDQPDSAVDDAHGCARCREIVAAVGEIVSVRGHFGVVDVFDARFERPRQRAGLGVVEPDQPVEAIGGNRFAVRADG